MLGLKEVDGRAREPNHGEARAAQDRQEAERRENRRTQKKEEQEDNRPDPEREHSTGESDRVKRPRRLWLQRRVVGQRLYAHSLGSRFLQRDVGQYVTVVRTMFINSWRASYLGTG